MSLMLLLLSRCSSDLPDRVLYVREYLASDIAFEATDDLCFAHSLCSATMHVGLGSRVVPKSDERTRAYMRRRTSEGMSKTEVIRCLKRYVAREVFSTSWRICRVPDSAPGPGDTCMCRCRHRR